MIMAQCRWADFLIDPRSANGNWTPVASHPNPFRQQTYADFAGVQSWQFGQNYPRKIGMPSP
jgi:hypothetical protein